MGNMNLLEAMEARHAIRAYTDEAVDSRSLDAIQAEIDAINAESGLHFQMASGLDDAFLGLKTHYGRFKDVHNAVALIGRPVPPDETVTGWHAETAQDEAATDPAEIALQEKVGYYGERLVLRIVQLGLQTSWSVLDDAGEAPDAWWTLDAGEKIVWVLAFGHGARPGGKHRSKPMEQLCSVPDGMALEDAPEWFRNGMSAAMLAPTSLSQQPFIFTLNDDGSVRAEVTEGLFAHVGLGATKYHFEIGAGRDNVRWED